VSTVSPLVRQYLHLLSPTGEVGKLLGAKWKELDESEKKPYVDQAAKDKERADEEKQAYDVSVSVCGVRPTHTPIQC